MKSRHSWWIVILVVTTILGAYGVYLDRQQTAAPSQTITVEPQPTDTSVSRQPEVTVVYQTSDPQVASRQEVVVNQAASKWAGTVKFVRVEPRTENYRDYSSALAFSSANTKFVVLQGSRPLNKHNGFLDEEHMDAFIRKAGVSGPPTSIPNKQPMR